VKHVNEDAVFKSVRKILQPGGQFAFTIVLEMPPLVAKTGFHTQPWERGDFPRPEAIMLKILLIILFHNSCEIVQLFTIIFRLFPKMLIAMTAKVTYMNIHEHTDRAYTCKSTCTKTLNNSDYPSLVVLHH